MKRFHVHVSVRDLPQSIGFYSRLFGTAPTVTKDDYAKWMLDEPRINFAISQRGVAAGVNHLGFQVDSPEELQALRSQAVKANIAAVEEKGAACCYAKSDKHWIQDPQGVAWEAFHTLGDIPVYGENAQRAAPDEGACCIPLAQSGDADAGACCIPAAVKEGKAACCA